MIVTLGINSIFDLFKNRLTFKLDYNFTSTKPQNLNCPYSKIGFQSCPKKHFENEKIDFD